MLSLIFLQCTTNPSKKKYGILIHMRVTLIAAVSIDGFISPLNQATSPSTHWTSKEDSIFFNSQTKKIGTCVMGRKTYETIPPNYRPLKDRISIVMTRYPEKIPQSQDISKLNPDRKDAIFHTSMPPDQLIRYLEDKHVQELAVCGGHKIYSQFIQYNAIDRLLITIEPLIFGKGIRLSDSPLSSKIELEEIHHLSSQTKVFEYVVVK